MWRRYLPEIAEEKVRALFQASGFSNDDVERALGVAALCRLAFASVAGVHDPRPSGSLPVGSVISETQARKPRGRPRTARWAFWAGFLAAEMLQGSGRRLTSPFLARFSGVLLDRSIVEPGEIRTVLGKLRAEAKEHATAAARGLLEGALREGMGDKDFAQRLRTELGEGLNSTTHAPPVIEAGSLSERWVERLLKSRRSILRRARKYGPLGGGKAVVGIISSTAIARGLPLGSTANGGGTIHLGKGTDVLAPELPRIAGSEIQLTIPVEALVAEPSAAALYAVPEWWWTDWIPLWVS